VITFYFTILCPVLEYIIPNAVRVPTLYQKESLYASIYDENDQGDENVGEKVAELSIE
jgi:hypothetical protein